MKFKSLTICMCAVLGLLGVGCNPLVIGPVQVEIPAGEASLPLPGGKQGVPLGATIPFCNLPSEEEITQMVQEVGGFDVSRFVRVSAIELQETRFEATSGNFAFANAARLELSLFDSETFELGTASAPQGFGDSIVLRPSSAVDILSIIRANDDYTGDICPMLLAEFTLNSVSIPATQFEIKVVVDTYVELGLF